MCSGQSSTPLPTTHFPLPTYQKGELFTSGYGLIVDYLSEAMHAMCEMDFTGLSQEYFKILPNLSERDKEGVRKAFSVTYVKRGGYT